MPTITSPHNQKLKEIRKLRMRRRDREREGRFVAEGEDLLAAADAAGWEPLERFCAAGSGLPGTPVEPKLLAEASGLASGTRALAVYAERWLDRAGRAGVRPSARRPRSRATSARSCGARRPSAPPASRSARARADPFGPKAVRASMGAVFEVPLARAAQPAELPGRTIALTPDAETNCGESAGDGATRRPRTGARC